jgi:hypothetical protein
VKFFKTGFDNILVATQKFKTKGGEQEWQMALEI